MKIDISPILDEIGAEINFEGKEKLSFLEDGLELTEPVYINVKVVNVGSTFFLKGRLKVKLRQNCCRCLKEFELPLNLEIEEKYARSMRPYIGKKEEIELADEDFVFPIEDDNSIDLKEAIRQLILTELPISPLCKKNCPGIAAEKEQAEKKIDPRLAKLKDLNIKK